MPVGDDVTVPDPVPVVLTVRLCAGWVAKFAVTDALPVVVNVVVAEDVVENEPPEPLQLLKPYPGDGTAVSEIGVPVVYPPVQFCAVFTVTEPTPTGLTAVDSGLQLTTVRP
jgi:hypothetical protein